MDLDKLTQEIKSKSVSVLIVSDIVAKINGEIYRLIAEPLSIDYCERLFFSPPILEQLYSKGLIGTEFIGKNSEGHIILKHACIPAQTRYLEWTNEQTRDLAIMVLRIQEELSKHRAYLRDPHGENVSFFYNRPVYFDFGSIHFCESDFSIENWLCQFWMGGNDGGGWQNLFNFGPATIQDLVSLEPFLSYAAQIRWLETVEIRKDFSSEWIDYDKSSKFDINDESTWQPKHREVRDLYKRIFKDTETVLDLGASAGTFVRILLKHGAKEVVACDIEEKRVDMLYETFKKEALPVTVVYSDLFRNIIGKDQWLDAERRFKSDCVLAVAVVHHLCYRRRMSLEYFAKSVSRYSKKYAIVQWIPYNDSCLEGVINKFGDDKKDYTEENFISFFQNVFPGEYTVIQSSSLRKMYLFSKT